MRIRIETKEEFFERIEILTMKLKAATIEHQNQPKVIKEKDGTLILIISVSDHKKIKDKELRETCLSHILSSEIFSNKIVAEAYNYRDDAVECLNNRNWNMALYYLEQAAFYEEDSGQPYAVTFLPLLEELEELLAAAGSCIPHRSIMLNRVCNKH